MKNTKTVLVLFGGCSEEYEVSLKSAAAVLQHLPEDRFQVIRVGITPDGQWYRYSGCAQAIAQGTWLRSDACKRAFLSPCRGMQGLMEFTKNGMVCTPVDVVIPILHGKNGEDGTVQGLLELSGIPYVGCGILSSALGMDKARAHALASAAGIAVPKGKVIRADEPLYAHTLHLDMPIVVKPLRSGSSYGISCVREWDALPEAMAYARQYDEDILLEEFLTGFEVGCAVIDTPDGLKTGVIDQITLAGDVFDYTEKYTLQTAKIELPAHISDEQAARVRETAINVYRTLGCEGLARVDFFVTEREEIVFHEINTMPGFTEHSRYPGMLCKAGWSFEEILEVLIDQAVKKR